MDPRTRPLLGTNVGPQDPSAAMRAQLDVSLYGDPGVRLAETTGRATQTWRGASVTPQTFVRGPANANAKEQLELAARTQVQRLALSRTRGRPGIL